MWTAENRGKYERKGQRYPSDLTDEEWALVEPEMPPQRRGRRYPAADRREVLDAILYVLSTGCQWRQLPKDFPPKSTVHDYLIDWHGDGTLARVLRPGSRRRRWRAPCRETCGTLRCRGADGQHHEAGCSVAQPR